MAVGNEHYDVVVYGGTSAGVMAAVQAARMSRRAVLVCPETRLGGMSAGGLGFTDVGNKSVIGGLSREFYHRIFRHYQRDDAWRFERREDYGNVGQGTSAIDEEGEAMWVFEPHVAEAVFEELIAEHGVPVYRDAWLDRGGDGVKRHGACIESIRTTDGRVFSGRMFLDATYEGDLLCEAGVSYRVGRESLREYGETWNGVQTGVYHHKHWFRSPIDPYSERGNPKSGLLPRISPEPPGEYGAADRRVQAYCYRMCLTDVPANRVPFQPPEGYDPRQYELLLRVYEAGWRETFEKFDPIPNAKTDTNNHGPFSTDNIGYNYDYPEASYERRAEIEREHTRYQLGLMYFQANDPRMPEQIRRRMAEYGLAADEFTDNGHWPHQLYVREARRMGGAYVLTEHDCLRTVDTPESIGMGGYTIDSHNVQRYVTRDGIVENEGDIGVHPEGAYRIAYGCLTPKRGECENLLVPVCCSTTHTAFGSVRMEPVFMVLGQSAATAAALSIDRSHPVQDLPYETLRERLLADGQIL